jgi:hypothetical protein
MVQTPGSSKWRTDLTSTDRPSAERRCSPATSEPISTPLPVPDLAYLLVRIGGSFVYTDVITGDAPDAEKAHAAVTALPT